MVFVWDYYEISMKLLLEFMGLFWGYYGISMGLLWDYYGIGISMGLLWDEYGTKKLKLKQGTVSGNNVTIPNQQFKKENPMLQHVMSTCSSEARFSKASAAPHQA